VKTRIQFLSFLATLAIAMGLISWGSALSAQTTPSAPSDQQQPQTQPTPDTPPTQQGPARTQPAPTPENPPAAQTPDQAQAPGSTPTTTTPSASDGQSFLGTVVKSGDKYVLKDDSGKTYDIDHQDDVKKFEGKRVKVQGTLDPTGTKIQVK
jgi:hypothetical protein